MRRWRARFFQGYLLLAVLGFAVLLALAFSVPYFSFDLAITRGVQRFDPRWFDTLMHWVSWPGFAPQAVIVAGLICAGLYARGLRWEAVCAGLTGAGITVVGLLIKLMVNRPRPTPDLVAVVEQLNSFSFPSGHVLFYTTFFGFLLFIVFTLFRPSLRRALLLAALSAPIALIGLSRIELGQHWFSDVLAAYLLGSLWLALAIQVYGWGTPRFFVRRASS